MKVFLLIYIIIFVGCNSGNEFKNIDFELYKINADKVIRNIQKLPNDQTDQFARRRYYKSIDGFNKDVCENDIVELCDSKIGEFISIEVFNDSIVMYNIDSFSKILNKNSSTHYLVIDFNGNFIKDPIYFQRSSEFHRIKELDKGVYYLILNAKPL
ncbi:MAG: hypothetical protein NT150_01500 [Bacteroidetes bacterium]|nr:hypothetical protein [Bacteroidota bacterium]